MPLLQGTHRYQIYMSSLGDFIAPDHPLHLIDTLVDKLDLNKLQITIPQSEEGRPAYHPGVLLKLNFPPLFVSTHTQKRIRKRK